MRKAPNSIGAPGSSITAFSPEHTANKLFIIGGPKMEVKLIKLVMPRIIHLEHWVERPMTFRFVARDRQCRPNNTPL